MNISKSTVECYKIRGLEYGGWADVTIDAKDEYGRISISSDYGDWQYFWSHCGCPFKQFLPTLEISYVADKFGADEWFDADKTIRLYKQLIINSRRNSALTKKDSRKIWNQAIGMEGLSESEFTYNFHYAPDLRSFLSNSDMYLSYSIHPLFKRFWAECWQPLMETLKQEQQDFIKENI